MCIKPNNFFFVRTVIDANLISFPNFVDFCFEIADVMQISLVFMF